MFDSHCHLNFEAFANQEEEIINGAKANDINFFLIPGTNLKTSQKAIQIAEKYPYVWAAVGIHPHHAQKYNIENLEKIKKLARRKIAVAIGEIGLDYHQYQKTKYDNYLVNEKFKQKQKELLQKQIIIAQQLKKPIIFHNREASEDFLKILSESGWKNFASSAVFHCCSPEKKLLNIAKEKQIYIGVDGDVTYDKKKAEFIKNVPLELLILETDSPYLTPIPIRENKRFPNMPKNLIYTARFIAQLKNISLQELKKSTTENAKKLFL